MLLRESLGISADGSEKAFGTVAIEAMIKRAPKRLRYDIREPDANINHVFVACDPSGGGASAFSIASLVQEANGFLQARTPNATRHTLHATRHTLQHSLPHVLVPHARERAAHDHEGLGPLRHAAQKRGNGRGQHARLQIGHQLRLALGKVRAHGRERV